MICGKCGEKLEDGAKFCGHCGWKVEGAEEAPVTAPVDAAEPEKKTEAEAPKEKKKINKLFLLIPAAVVVLAGIIIGVVCFVNSLKREQVDLSEVVSFEVTGYSGYGVAKLVIDEDTLEDTYRDIISEHTKVRWNKFVNDVDLLEYEVTDLTDLSNGDTITLTWEYDKDKASEEYKVDIVGENVVYTVTGLTEIKKIDPFEDFEVTFSGVSGDGYADVSIKNYEDYLDYFWYETSERYGLSNGDEVVVSFDISGNRDWVAETYGYELYPTEKAYTVSGLTEYVLQDTQVTDVAVKPMLEAAEELFYDHVKDYWNEESSVKNLECVGHFISKSDSMSNSTKNVIGLIYKVNANVFMNGRDLNVEYYYPVMFKNVMLSEDGTFSYDEYNMFRTSDRFSKQFEPENEEDVNVPGGSWYFYGYETKEAMEDAYSDYVTGWTTVETENFVYKDYTEAVNGQMKKDIDAELQNIKEGNPEVLIADAVSRFLDTIWNWQSTASVNGVTCVNTMLYSNDILSAGVPKTCYDVVLKVDARVEYADMAEDFPFYYVVRYQNVTVGEEGKLTADYSTVKTVNGEFKKMLGEEEIRDWWFSSPKNVWWYDGYQTLDEALDLGNEIRMGHVLYRKVDSVSRVEEDVVDLTAWGKADDTAVVATADAKFREAMTGWGNRITISSVEKVDSYLVYSQIPSRSKEYAVLLKATIALAHEDLTEDFELYTMVRFANAQLTDGAVTVGECIQTLQENLISKQLGDEIVYGPEGVMNVWDFYGFLTPEEAVSTALPVRDGHINYTVEKMQAPVEDPVVTPEDPTVIPGEEGETPAEGDNPAEGETPEDPAVVPEEGETPVEGEKPVEGETSTEGENPAEGDV